MSSKKRRTFTDEFKKGAIQLLEEKGYSLKEASDALGVSINSLRLWRKNRRLRKELERIKLEREILKKALGYFAAEDPK